MEHKEIIDFRDLTVRVEELEEAKVFNPEDFDEDEYRTLTELLDETKGYGGDHQWRGDWYPDLLIAADHFEDYARSFAEDIGAVNADAAWPNSHIDWSAAAEDLKKDYSEIEVDGRTYFYR